jgi:hypothetical protein
MHQQLFRGADHRTPLRPSDRARIESLREGLSDVTAANAGAVVSWSAPWLFVRLQFPSLPSGSRSDFLLSLPLSGSRTVSYLPNAPDSRIALLLLKCGYCLTLYQLVNRVLQDPDSPPNFDEVEMLPPKAPVTHGRYTYAELPCCFIECYECRHLVASYWQLMLI